MFIIFVNCIGSLLINYVYFILAKRLFVSKLYLHKNSFLLKSTALNPIVIFFFCLLIKSIFNYVLINNILKYILLYLDEFQQTNLPSSRPISPWSSTSSSSAGILVVLILISVDFILNYL